MRAFRHLFSRRRKGTPVTFEKPFPELWDALLTYSAQIQDGAFMQEMVARYRAAGQRGGMGASDCALLYALTCWKQPEIVIESGGYLGMSSAFILKALADSGLKRACLYSIECDRKIPHGALIPDNLRERFIPVTGDVKELVKSSELPPAIDMFLHDSSHRYRHMLWEFETFWKRLRGNGLLVSHDVDFNAAFPQFIANTYSHYKDGMIDIERTEHAEWARWGYLAFAIKQSRPS